MSVGDLVVAYDSPSVGAHFSIPAVGHYQVYGIAVCEDAQVRLRNVRKPML